MITINDEEFKQITEFIKTNYGINLGKEKKALINGRLSNVLAEHNFESFSQYFEYLVLDKSGNALTTLINKITTNHTFFMREASHFDYFRDKVLPLLTVNSKDKDLRIWSAGCSTGEEPYTLAMIISDFFEKEKALWDTKILATDISEKVLNTAKKGIYSNDQISTIPAAWRLNYFNKADSNSSSIVSKIRDEVIYRKFNLMDPQFPFKKKFHVIFCRNVMIYFDSKTRTELINKFYDVLEPGGFLFIGHSESIDRETTRFKYVMPAVYSK